MDIDFDDLTAGPSGTSGLAASGAAYDIAEDPSTAGLLAELDRKSAARKLALPTNDLEVRRRLRSYKQPITVFGEKREDRRERLRSVIIKDRQARGLDIDLDGSGDDGSSDDGEDEEEKEKEEEFYTEGDDALEKARRYLAAYSVPRAKKRIQRQRMEASVPLSRILDTRKAVFSELKTYTSLGSQFADERPICGVRFSPDSKYLVTASWSGTAKIWDVPGCRMLDELKGHDGERLGAAIWHPQATLSQSREAVNIVTSGADFNIQTWNLSGLDADPSTKKPSKPLSTLKGHSHRVCKLSFHPSGKYLASASYDGTWRLWDVNTSQELLLQEGHSKELYSVAFQPDEGSLVASGGLDAIGRVWDVRSGRSVMVLDGHIRDILSLDWSPGTGYQLASGSNDDTVKIWDLRMIKCLYTIPAHRSTVSDVKFFKAEEGLKTFPVTIKPTVKQEPKPNGVPNGLVAGEEEQKPDVAALVDAVDAAASAVANSSSSIANNADGATASGWAARTSQRSGQVPINGIYLATSGYDGFVKMWSADDWQLVKSLNSEAGGRVMSVDLAQNGKFLATGEWSRTFKLFAAQDVAL